MYGCQQFKTERRLEPFDEFGHSAKAFSTFGEIVKEGASFIHSPRDDFEAFAGRVSAIGISIYEMAFNVP